MSWPWWLLLVAFAYLLGSLSPSMWLVSRRTGRDVRELGSGNPGATNVQRILGSGAALLVVTVDVAKGLVSVGLARALEAPGPVIGLVAMAVVVGHMAPIYYGLRGGKGVATASGALGSLAPVPALLGLVIFVVVVWSTRFVALGSVTAVAAFPLLAYASGRLGWSPPAPGWLLASALAIAALVSFKHHTNLTRIHAGTEGRIGDPRTPEEIP